jgi:PAS domain S-box-containing protein
MYKIIVIDDDDSLREIIVELLKLNEFDVLNYSGGIEGIKGITENKPDLVVCDIMMPEVNGYDVLKMIRNNPEVKNTPFVFLSAKIETKDFRKGMNLGADDYLTKPFELEELLKIIKSRIRKHQDLLKESEYKYRTLFEQSSDGILICDVDGIISDINTSFTDILGYSKEDLTGLRLCSLKMDEEDKLNETLKKLLDYNSVITEEIDLKDKNGNTINIEYKAKRIYRDIIQIIIRDISK